MRSFLFFLLIVFVLGISAALAQKGGKAEPLRIKFAKGKTNTVLTRTLTNDEQMEYIFGASKGQTVTIKNTKTSLFEVKVFSVDNFSENDFDSSTKYTFTIPETGDYNLFIRKKQTSTPRTARFSVTLIIK
jgi:hypothetical protein